MTRGEEIAWAAGLFEGEGCIARLPDRPHQIRLQLGSSDRDVVERFAAVVGCGSISYRQSLPRLSDTPKPMWIWVAVAVKAAALLEEIFPYLGERRSERARELLEFRAEHIAHSTKERSCPTCSRLFRPQYHAASSRQQYCSPQCCADANIARTKARRIHPPRTCVECGSVFTPKRNDNVYCAVACRNKVGKRTMRAKRKVDV
jgi:hypothetical protein